MALTPPALYQSKPAATTLTDLYKTTAGKMARVRLMACNQDSATADSIRVLIADDEAATDVKQYIAYDMALDSDTPAQWDFLMDQTDEIRVYSANGDVSFTAIVVEEDR